MGKHQQGRGNTWWTNAKSQQLIKHTKISYSIALLEFLKFSCAAYRNGLQRGTSKLRHSKFLEKYEPFVQNPHFSLLKHRVWYLKILFVSWRKQVIIFPGWVYNPKLRMRVHKQPFSSACKRYDFKKQKFDVKQLKMNKFTFDVKQLKINQLTKCFKVTDN